MPWKKEILILGRREELYYDSSPILNTAWCGLTFLILFHFIGAALSTDGIWLGSSFLRRIRPVLPPFQNGNNTNSPDLTIVSDRSNIGPKEDKAMSMKRVKSFVFFAFGLLAVLVLTGLLSAKSYKKWNIHDKMTRAEIQAVINIAEDGDHIIFKKGVYDWSDAFPVAPIERAAALNIIDKSLVIVGAKGNLIKGAPSTMNSDGYGQAGIIAFQITNPAGDKSVAFDGLNFRSFLMVISALGAKDFTVQNCRLEDSHRNAIAVMGTAGHVLIADNYIETYRIGTYTIMGSQPDGDAAEVKGNTVEFLGASKQYVGIYFATPLRVNIHNNTINGHASYWGNAVQFDGNSAQPIIVTKNTANSLGHGIYLNGTANVEVSDNVLTNILQRGIVVYSEGYTNFVLRNTIVMNGQYPTPTPGNDWEFSFGICTIAHNNYFAHNTISGIATVAIQINGQFEICECNDVHALQLYGQFHYAFMPEATNNRISETWATGATWVNWGDDSNIVTTITCNY